MIISHVTTRQVLVCGVCRGVSWAFVFERLWTAVHIGGLPCLVHRHSGLSCLHRGHCSFTKQLVLVAPLSGCVGCQFAGLRLCKAAHVLVVKLASGYALVRCVLVCAQRLAGLAACVGADTLAQRLQ
jgi:hypothetical protein